MARNLKLVKNLPSQKSRQAAKAPSANRAASDVPNSFVKVFFENVMHEDLASFSTKEKECMASSIWNLAQQRKPGQINLRLFNPSPEADGWDVDHTVLELVNDDMPFLVDSVTGALQRRGLVVHLSIHPVLQVRRDLKGKLLEFAKSYGEKQEESDAPVPISVASAESFMQIQFDHCLDPALLREIEKEIYDVLDDVRMAVADWPKMRRKMEEVIDQAAASKHQENPDENTEEARAFLRWLDSNNFTYLGYRDINLVQKNGQLVSIEIVPDSGLGILRDKEVRMFGGLRDKDAKRSPYLQSYVRKHQLLVVSKTNVHARVHRQVAMDAFFIRRFDNKGDVIGEHLFVGLLTSQSYTQPPREIPFLRRKLEYVIDRAGFRPDGHDGKSLVHILNNYPYDELFQITEDDLYHNALSILQLQERARVALLTRRDAFGRFVTCLIYVPRDHYNSALRDQFQTYLEAAFGGTAQEWQVRIDDSLLARTFVTLTLPPTAPNPDVAKIEEGLRDLTRSWSDRLRDCLVAEHGEAAALALLRRYGNAFPASYRQAIEPIRAVRDIHNMEFGKTALASGILVDLSPPDEQGLMRLKLFQAERPIVLSDVLPLIENSGLKIEYMGGPYEIRPKDSAKSIFIHKFVGKSSHPSIAEFRQVKPAYEEVFGKVWTGEVENDGFNALSLCAGLGLREITLLRCFARYLRQLRIPYSHEMMVSTFLNHPKIAQQMHMLFFARHNPDLTGNRAGRCKEIETQINETLGHIKVLEEDRIIRRYLNLIQASLRTNFFQHGAGGSGKPYLSIKFDSRAIDFMPLPKPLYEIFVYSPRAEAVHLRGGKVARGGIRWSDRRDDFRNEILGLMKAQMVKNTVIVPTGSKGGFIVKHPPADPAQFSAEGIACYRIMMCGMLDITDNLIGGKVVPPVRVVRHDGDDPYLVVAADKGTAKFSDIANGISQEYKFWLDDAFASGGSVGYDHKEMAITARGAWEAIKRHFREIGKNIQEEDFTCIGVGDMSGDVFGNGMLLSKHIRLLGAFDHRHIFCDPSPDSATSFVERQRLFKLPRSSWADYDAKKISKGGGVFSRSEKFIRLSPEMKKAYGVTADTLQPAELIQAMLKAQVELLYFGGIGTYIKASYETHEDVGDRATEMLRIDGCDVRAAIVGEGANLGVTQRGRIEFALKGGRINTDAIDNSAGVDTSDHEVNIKILLRKVVERNGLTFAARNKLLESMTDDVACLVLKDNYKQTQALSIAESQASELLPLHVRTMHFLEKAGLLNRAVEFLPESSDIAERQRTGLGLTRPELAVLLAYAKIWLYQQLLEVNSSNDSYSRRDIEDYFPAELKKKYGKDIAQHQLAKEIIATVVTNSIVNRAGSHFVFAMMDRTGKDIASIARAYLVARNVFDMRELWKGIQVLDNKVPAKVQTQMHHIVRQALNDSVLWFLSEIELKTDVSDVIATYSKAVGKLAEWINKHPANVGGEAKRIENQLVSDSVPAQLAQRIALLPTLGTALNLARLSVQSGNGIDEVTEVFFALGQRLGFAWLIERAQALALQTPWQREALSLLLRDLIAVQRDLTAKILGKKSAKDKTPGHKLQAWLTAHATGLERFDGLLGEWRNESVVDTAILTLATRQLAELLV
jgi:glutamate dehydrogenase